MDLFLQQLLSGVAIGGIYALVALAVVMIYQASDHFNFAQGEMATFTTYVAWWLIAAGLPYWLAFLATILIAFAGAVALERIVIRPVEHAPALSQVIVFIGLSGDLQRARRLAVRLHDQALPEPVCRAAAARQPLHRRA